MSSASVTPSTAGVRRARWPVIKPITPENDRPAIRLNRTSCVVGDRSRVHLRLASALVSRAHALIVIDESDVYVRDLASRNRVYLNGSPVREASLRPADLLRVGPFQFRCWAGFAPRSHAGAGPARRLRGTLSWNGSRQQHRIADRTFLIGRRPDCDLAVAEQTISRVHAVVFHRNGRHVVRDLNSRNGTFVNGERVREAELNDGDELQIYRTALRYHATVGADDEIQDEDALCEVDGHNGADALDVANAEASGAVAGTSLSLTGSSVGERTTGSSSVDDRTIQPDDGTAPERAVPATAGDFEFDAETPSAALLRSGGDGAAEGEHGVITAAELFPPETSLVSDIGLRIDDDVLGHANGHGNGHGKANGHGHGNGHVQGHG